MSTKRVFALADVLELKLRKYAELYPNNENVKSKVEALINNLKPQIPLLNSVTQVSNVDVQTGREDSLTIVYFQLVVDPQQYRNISSEPTKTTLINTLKEKVENHLSFDFGVPFRVTVGIAPA